MEPGQINLDDISVLIVEDEALVAFALQTYLLNAGARLVETASSLTEGEQKYIAAEFDVVLLDVRLPDGEAYDFARRLIADNVPVVIHSGHASANDEPGLAEALFCAKPAMPAEVLVKIGEALAR